MIPASCHCGSVRIEVEATVSEVTECNCSLCRRYGVLWVYLSKEKVRVSPSDPPTDTYLWNGRNAEFHHCRTCGCVTHWTPVDHGRDLMAVNARMMEPEVLAAARVRHLDGADTNRYLD